MFYCNMQIISFKQQIENYPQNKEQNCMSLQSNIWQEAIKQKNSQSKEVSKQKTFIFLGNEKSGKTSLIKLLKNQSSNQQTKPTILFQYSFIKNISNKKQLINCYELSNKSQKQLIPSLITKDSFANTIIILCVDLSKPGNIIDDVKQWMNIIRTQFGIACQEKVNLQQKSREYLKKIHEKILEHEDSKLIKPLPMQTIIVGTKYDEYQKQDSQNRKWLSRALRYLAISNYCSLFYSSIKNSQANTQIQSILTQSIFSLRFPTFDLRDHMKPIFLTPGQDTISSLGLPISGSINILQIIKKQIGALFSSQQQKKRQGIDVAKYSQSRIDKIIQDHKKEMQKINKVNNRFADGHAKFKM